MKLTNEKIIAFKELDVADKKLPIKLSWAIAANDIAIAPFADAFYKKKNEIIQKYAKKDNDGQILVDENNNLSMQNATEWIQEMNDLFSATIEIPITTVSINELEKCDTENFDSLSVAEIGYIAFMIEN